MEHSKSNALAAFILAIIIIFSLLIGYMSFIKFDNGEEIILSEGSQNLQLSTTYTLSVTALLRENNSSLSTIEQQNLQFTVAAGHINMQDYYERIEESFSVPAKASYTQIPSGGGGPMTAEEFDIEGNYSCTVILYKAAVITIDVYLKDSENGTESKFGTFTKKVFLNDNVNLSDYTAEIDHSIAMSYSAGGNYTFDNYYDGNQIISSFTASENKTVKCIYESYRYVNLTDGIQTLKLYFKEDKLYDISTYESSLIAPSGKIFIGWSLENDVTKLISNTQIDKESYAGKTIYAVFHEPIAITLQVKLYDADGSSNIFRTYTKSYKYGSVAALSDFDFQMNSDIGQSISAAGNYEFIGYYNGTSKIDMITATSDITLEARWEVYKYATLSNGTQQIKVYFKEDNLYDLSLYVSSLVVPDGQDFIGWSLENDVTKLISNTQIDKATYAGKTIYAIFHEKVTLTLNMVLLSNGNGSSIYKTYVDSYKYGTIVDLNESYMQKMESDLGHSTSGAGNYYFSTFQGASNDQITMTENISVIAQWKEFKYASIIGYNQTIKAYFKDSNVIDLNVYISSLILPEGKEFIWFSSLNNYDYDGESVITSIHNNDHQSNQAVYAVFHEPVDLTIKATLVRALDDGTSDSDDTKLVTIENLKFGSTVYMSDYVKEIKDLFPGIDCEVGPTLGSSGGGGVPSTITEFVIKGDTTVLTQVFDNRVILTSRYFFEEDDYDYMSLSGLSGKNISGFSKGDTIDSATIQKYIDDVISSYSIIVASKKYSKVKEYPELVSYKVYTDYNCTQELDVASGFTCNETTNFLYVKIIKDKFLIEFIVKDNITNPIFFSYVSEPGNTLKFPDKNYNTYNCVTNSTFGTGNKYKFIGWTLTECSISDWDANKRDYDYISTDSNIIVASDLTIYASNYKYSGLVGTWSSKFVYDGDETVTGNLWNNIVEGAQDLIPENAKKWLIGIGISAAVLIVLIIIIKAVKK